MVLEQLDSHTQKKLTLDRDRTLHPSQKLTQCGSQT